MNSIVYSSEIQWDSQSLIIFPVGMRAQCSFPMGMKFQGIFLIGTNFRPIFPVGRGSHRVCDTGCIHACLSLGKTSSNIFSYKTFQKRIRISLAQSLLSFRPFLALFYGKTLNDYYMLSILIIYSLKGVIQANVIHYLSRKCVLWKFIHNLNEFLTDIKVCENIKVHEKRFRNKTYLGFFITSLIIAIFASVIVTMVVYPPLGELAQTLTLSPFANNTAML